jgi:hypothetical protein
MRCVGGSAVVLEQPVDVLMVHEQHEDALHVLVCVPD